MPSVTVNLYASFRKHIGGQPSISFEIERGESIAQILERLGIPVEEARIIFCNNRIVDADHQLEGGELIGVFPAIGGG
jgi:sulfur carrier protein ThiS